MDEASLPETKRGRDDSGAEEAESDSPFAIGKVLSGNYRIDRVTGRGALCAVVAARHLQLDQLVAIKYVQGDPRKNPSVVGRFLREARLATRIRSEHAVHIHDVQVLPDGTSYIVMDHLEGMDLRKMLEGGALLVKRAIDYVLQACDAIAEAHVAGVLHGDLKPENVFLAHRAGGPVIKVLDFGISTSDAKKGDSARAWELASADRLAAPAYMAPEQLAPHASIDERTDIWALGVLLYELVSGALPFGVAPSDAVCDAIAKCPPIPLGAALPNAPEELGLVLARCLEKDRQHRYQNVAELAVALAPFAPSIAGPRIERIARIIRDAGGQVPALPPSADVPAPAPPTDFSPEQAGATDGLASSALPPDLFRPRRRWLKVTPLALVGASLAAVILMRGSVASRTLPSSAAPLPPAATGAPVAPPMAATVAPPAPSESPPAPSAAQTELPRASSLPARPPPPARIHKRYDAQGGGANPPPARAKPVPTDPDAVINPFK